MIVEAVDIIADWLADATNGVNALLPGVARGHGDAVPPNVVSIFAETRNGEVARGKLPEETTPTLYPALVVARPNTTGLITAVRTNRWDGAVELAISYAVRQVVSDLALRQAGYTIRAVLRSLWRLEDGALAAANTARSPAGLDITLRGFDDGWQILGVEGPFEDKIVLASLVVRLNLEDTKPGG